MTKPDSNIELRSDAVREIIGKPPAWLVQWGTLTMALIILLLLIGSFWFRYPDMLQSEVKILSPQPPVEVVARNDGFLDFLLVQDSQLVQSGQVLGVLQSSVNYEFVRQIEPELDSVAKWFSVDSLEGIASFFETSRQEAGSLKGEYGALLTALRNYYNFRIVGKYDAKLRAAKLEEKNTRIHYDRIYYQKGLRKQDLDLAEKQVDRQRSLLSNGAISELEFEQSTQDYLQKKLLFEEARTSLSAYQIDLDKIHERIQDLELQKQEDSLQVATTVYEKMNGLQGAISEWYVNYVFLAPISGIVTFNQIYSEKQQVKTGERVMTIIQTEIPEIVGVLSLPVKGAGKAAVGQKVMVKLDKYPYMEYGELVGEIRKISLVADQRLYTVEVGFANGLKSSYDKELKLSQGMTGQAEIITENLSLLVRIVNPIKFLLKRNKEINHSSPPGE